MKTSNVKEVNLHDYVANTRPWHQLWADDTTAIWFEDTPNGILPYEVFYCYRNILCNNEVYTMSHAVCKDLSEAMSTWNNLINNLLDNRRINKTSCV